MMGTKGSAFLRARTPLSRTTAQALVPLEVLGRHIKESILAQHFNPDHRTWGVWRLAYTASKGVRAHRFDCREWYSADDTLDC